MVMAGAATIGVSLRRPVEHTSASPMGHNNMLLSGFETTPICSMVCASQNLPWRRQTVNTGQGCSDAVLSGVHFHQYSSSICAKLGQHAQGEKSWAGMLWCQPCKPQLSRCSAMQYIAETQVAVGRWAGHKHAHAQQVVWPSHCIDCDARVNLHALTRASAWSCNI